MVDNCTPYRSDPHIVCSAVGGSGIGTGFYRDGHCSTGPLDEGRHTVCIEATAEFLAFSASVGNDLSTPIPAYNFPYARTWWLERGTNGLHIDCLLTYASEVTLVWDRGVNPGDRWCLCASRWVQALNAGATPKVHLLATHEKTLSIVRPEDTEKLLAALKMHAADADKAEEVQAELDAKRAKLESML